jgi:hypothetical protein
MMPQLIRGLTSDLAKTRAGELLGYLGLGERLTHRPADRLQQRKIHRWERDPEAERAASPQSEQERNER